MQISSAIASKDVLIISADGFDDSELLQPYRQLRKKGLSVDISVTSGNADRLVLRW